MNKINKLVVASAIAFFGITAVGIGVGYASWTYADAATSAVSQTVAAAVGDWHYLIEDGMFYKMAADGTVDWHSSIDGSTYNASGSSTSSYHVTNAKNPSGTDVCAYYPYHGTLKKTTTVVTITGVDGVTDSSGSYISPFDYPSYVKQVYLPTAYSSIGDGAFAYSTGLKEVHFFDATSNGYPASSALTIGNSAFWSCDSLTVVDLPANLDSIGSYAFGSYNTTLNLTINYSGTVYQWFNDVTLNSYWHYYCAPTVICSDATVTYTNNFSDTCTVAYNNTATAVAASTFSGNTNLTAVTLGSKVASIGASAFYNASSLTNIALTPTVTSIGANAFGADNSASTLAVAYSGNIYSWMQTTSKDSTWHSGRAVTVTCSDAVASYQSGSTSYSVVYDNQTTSVDANTFNNETALSSVTLGTGVTSLGASSFFNTSGLTTLSIPSNVTSIGANAFGADNSASRLAITYDGSIYSWMRNVTKDSTWHSGRAVTVTCNDAKITYQNYTSDYTVTYLAGATEVAAQTFLNETNLTAVNFVSSISNIGSYAFSGCTGLTAVTFKPITGSSDLTIEDHAFYDCTSLTSVKITRALQSMGSYAFATSSSNATAIEFDFANKSNNNGTKWANLLKNTNYTNNRTNVTVKYNATI
jgi:hypothetical protein